MEKLEHNDSRIGEFSVLPMGFHDPSIRMGTLDGDELVNCPRDAGISGCDKEWLGDVLCLLRSSSSGNAGDLSVVSGLDWRGLDHWRGIVWDPGSVGKLCLHVCYDCLCLIVLFRDAMMFVHDWAALATLICTEIRDWRTITWELGCLGSIHLNYYVTRFFCRNVWQIKYLEAVMTPGGADDIPFLLSACECGTSVGVIAPGMLPIQVNGLLDCVGGPLICSDWLALMSRWVWLYCHRMSMRGAIVVCPGVVRIEYKRWALAGSSSLDAVPVTGSLLFYASVCYLADCCATEISSWVLFDGTDCIWLAVCGLLFWRVSVTWVMATDSAAATRGRAGITFDVELVVP